MRAQPLTTPRGTTERPEAPPVMEAEGLDAFLKALSVAKGLNSLIPEHHFAVLRDPRTGTVVIAIRYRSTGELIDIRQPDAMFDMLEHLPGCWTGIEE